MFKSTELTKELDDAAEALSTRLRVLGVPTRKIALREWNALPGSIHKMIPYWLPSLLAKYSLHGCVLQHSVGPAQWRHGFFFWGPKEYKRNLAGKNFFYLRDEIHEKGLAMISDATEGESNMWLVDLEKGPSSPVFLLDRGAYEVFYACEDLACFISTMAVDEESYQYYPQKDTKERTIWSMPSGGIPPKISFFDIPKRAQT